MKVRVSIKKWLRGGKSNSGETALLNSAGQMCCLGFACRQLGIPKKQILHVSMPATVLLRDGTLSKLKNSPLIGKHGLNSRLSLDAADINDNQHINDKSRMTKLRALFKRKGHKIVFVP